MKPFMAVLTAALLAASAAWVSETPAQGMQQKPSDLQAPAPGAAPQAPAPGGAPQPKEIEGKVKSIDAAKKTITLDDGTTLMAPDASKLQGLKPGTMIKASYEERNGQKVVTSLGVKQ